MPSRRSGCVTLDSRSGLLRVTAHGHPYIAAVIAIAMVLLSGLLPGPAQAQTVTLTRNHPAAALDALTNQAAADQPLNLRVSFALRNPDQLKQLLRDQQNPSSPQYHRWLSPDQFDRRFGRTTAEVGEVSAWLKDQGFQVG